MKVTINGSTHDVESATVAALLEELNLPPDGIAVAVNWQVVPHRVRMESVLNEGDEVEILTAHPGG